MDANKALQKEQKRSYSLHALSAFSMHSKTALDLEEEASGAAQLAFLTKKPTRKASPPKQSAPPQGNWEMLEEELPPPPKAPVRAEEPSENWYEIPEARLTPELAKDLRLIANRQHLDPKRFYKSSGSTRRRGELETRVHVGQVVAGAHEFYSGRIAKRDRRATVLDEVLADQRVVGYVLGRFGRGQAGRRRKKRS